MHNVMSVVIGDDTFRMTTHEGQLFGPIWFLFAYGEVILLLNNIIKIHLIYKVKLYISARLLLLCELDFLCTDCNVAEPVIYKKLEVSSSNVILLRAYVGDRPTWRNPSHSWRVDPRFKVKGVPTLIRWENGGVTKRLEDYEAHVEEKIESLLASKWTLSWMLGRWYTNYPTK